MKDKKEKTVNTEEQNRVVNPGDRNDAVSNRPEKPQTEKTSSGKDDNPSPSRSDNENPGRTENPGGGSEVERPHRIEGDDPDKIERRLPNM